MTLKNRIWITYKSRIAAENRLKNNDLQTQSLLVWYAFSAAVISVLSIRYPKFLGDDTDIFSAIFSIALLVISLWVTNRDYRGRSLMMRSNHLQMKRLIDQVNWDGDFDLVRVSNDYSNLLNECENHTSYDYNYFRIIDATNLETNIPSWSDRASLFFFFVIRWGIYSFLYSIPLLTCFYYIK